MSEWSEEKKFIFDRIQKLKRSQGEDANKDNYEHTSVAEMFKIYDAYCKKYNKPYPENKYIIKMTMFDKVDSIGRSGYYCPERTCGSIGEAYRFDSKEDANQLIKELKELKDICEILYSAVIHV